MQRQFRQPFLLMYVADFAILGASAYLGFVSRYGEWPSLNVYKWPSVAFATVMLAAMMSMGVYRARAREGYIGMTLRTAVAIFFIGTIIVAVISYAIPVLQVSRGTLLFSTIEAFALLCLTRIIYGSLLDENALKSRVLVLGTGKRAAKVAHRMRRRSDQVGFLLVGFVQPSDTPDLISDQGATLLDPGESLEAFSDAQRIDEIVVAIDERRQGADNAGLPLDDLMNCRLSGVAVTEVQEFIEREAAKVDVDLLQPSWIVFSDGFSSTRTRLAVKRGFDVVASLLLLGITWPLMLIAAGVLTIGGRFREPVLYRQARVGLNGEHFNVFKFRSMRVDAEDEGRAQWAQRQDPRVTRFGALMRTTRIDELPQLFNVFRGDMSFVGPRPERPELVAEIAARVPFYEQRHRVKPGITGWAQLRYPYGASIEDAQEKLQYDLYYLKHHSLLLDLIILFQTVEVVLVGDGVR